MANLIYKALTKEPNVKRLVFNMDNKVETAVSTSIIKQAEDFLCEDFPYLSLSLYRDFSKTGNRKGYEDLFFKKRRMVSVLTIAETLEGKGRFTEKLEDGIWSILSEPFWTIPAHNVYVRDTEQSDTPNLSRHILDLFSCETGEILAISASLLEGTISPILIKDIHHTIKQRILEPYTTDHFWWMGGAGELNNWAPWCTQNVLISTLSLPSLSEKEKHQILTTATITLDKYIDSYPEDGGCDEGASYYHAAALALWGCIDILSRCTTIDSKDLFKNKKIQAMATFIEKVHIEDDLYLNFADCSPKAGYLGAREYLFAKDIGNTDMMHHAAKDFVTYSWEEADNNYNLFYKYLAVEHSSEIHRTAKKPFISKKPLFTLFEDTELAIYREKDITFAIKGGHNDESHNHNDVGSFILYKGATPLLIDIGVETYTKKTFSQERYELKPMQSTYHNVVNFPPVVQKNGRQYCSTNAHFDQNSAFIELRESYQKDERLKKYNRSVFFDRNNNALSFSEDIESSLPSELTLMSVQKPSIGNNFLSYDTFSITFSSSIEVIVEDFAVQDARLRLAWPEMLYKTVIKFNGSISWTVEIK